MLRTATVDEATAWLMGDEPYLTVIGSGVSIPPPACAPPASFVVEATIDILRDLAQVPEPNRWRFRDRVLPESCYSAIAATVGHANHLRLWQSYSWVDTESSAVADQLPPAPLPNAGHHLAVWLAGRSRLPLLTTNFDGLLEAAAMRQARAPLVVLPRGSTSFNPAFAAAGEIAIWKLHGSGHAWQTVRSQAADLVRDSLRALRRVLAARPKRILVAGYSGRDFDLFPWLVRLGQHAETLWVDLNFGMGHRARSMPNCMTVTADFETLAREFWAKPDSRTAQWVPIVNAAQAISGTTSDLVRQEFADRVGSAVRREVAAALGDDPMRARAALAAAINTAADFPLAQEIIETIPTDRMDVRTRMLSFLALSSMDRHRDSEAAARAARALALRKADLVGTARAELATTYSRQRRFITTFQDPDILAVTRRRLRDARVLARVLADGVLLTPAFLVAIRRARRRMETARHYDLVDLGSDYVEHWIRIGALVDAQVASLMGAKTSVVLGPFWRIIGRLSVRIGYVRGVLNVGKYRSRHRGDSERGFDVRFGVEVVGDYVAGAIAVRDAGLRLLRTSASDADRQAAAQLLTRSMELGVQAGSPTLVLKALLIGQEYKLPRPRSAPDPGQLTARLQGEADMAAIPVILHKLGPSPTVEALP